MGTSRRWTGLRGGPVTTVMMHIVSVPVHTKSIISTLSYGKDNPHSPSVHAREYKFGLSEEAVGGRKTAPWLRMLVALAEDPSLIPSPHNKWLITVYNSSSRRSNVPFWPPWALQSHAYTHTKTHNFFIKSLFYFFKKIKEAMGK